MKLYRTLCGILCLLTNISYSQNLIQGTTNSGFSGTKFPDARIQNIKPSKDLFNSANSFIENIGQYGNSMPGYENMGSVKYGFEGFEMPVLFTTKGLIYLHRKIEGIKNKKELEIAIKKVPDDEIERERRVTDKIITMEWLGANTNVEIIVEDKSDAYHTYGMLKGKAIGFKKITYKELYPGQCLDIILYKLSS